MNVARSRLAVMVVVMLLVAAAAPATSFASKGGVLGQGVTGQTALFVEDEYEPDDRFQDAYAYVPANDGNTFSSQRTFHGVDGEEDDEFDHIAVTVNATGTPIWVETMYVDGWADTRIRIYGADNTATPVASADDHDLFPDTYSESVYYVTSRPGVYYLQIENYSDYPFAYELHVTVGDARRIWGANRFATAAEVSRLQWDMTGNPYYGTGYGPEYIVIANGHNPADALAGGSLAAQLDGVLLLTHQHHLPWETRAEIERIAESRFWNYDDVTVYVLGGPGVVSDNVFKELQKIREVSVVKRVWGRDRYETAAKIATETSKTVGLGTTAYVVNGHAWADALAVAPVAAWDQAPVLMTRQSTVPTVTMDWLEDNGITDVVIVGGEGVVSSAVASDLAAVVSTVTRVGGANRYETAKKIALHGVNNLGMQGKLATLVSGETFADALAAAPVGWWTGAPVLLTTKNSLHPEVKKYFDVSGAIGVPYSETPPTITQGIGCYVLGGSAAISDATYKAFRDLWKLLP